MKSIVILIDYFGSWPKWFPVFLASCASNNTVNWVIRTDCDVPTQSPGNVKFISTSFADYVANVSSRLQIDFFPAEPYKICDIRPAFGDIYRDEIESYDYFGFSDLDVIYGNIRKFYTDEILSFDLLSTHIGMVSGHFVLFKNTETMRRAYSRIPGWKSYLENPFPTRFDEDVFSQLFVQCNRVKEIDAIFQHGVYFKEQFSTVFHPMPWHDGMAEHPDVWFWKNGAILNNRNIGREYLYLHLMNFQSMRWVNPNCRKNHVPWRDNPDASFVREGEVCDGVRIDWAGIHRLTSRS